MAFTDTSDAEEADRLRIQMLCDALRSDAPMRHMGFAALQDDLQDSLDTRLLLHTLARPRPAALRRPYIRRWLLGMSKIHPEYTPREIAAWTLGHAHIPQELKYQSTLLLANTLRDAGGKKTSIQFINIRLGWLRGWLLFFAIYSTVFFAFAFGSGRPPLAMFALFVIQLMVGSAVMATFFSPIFVTIALGQTNKHRDKMRAAAAQSLGRLAAPEGLGALADALRDRPGDVRTAAIVALPAVASALTLDWYGRIPAGTTRDVSRALRCTSLPAPTRLLLVHALEIIGDGSGVREVEALLADQQPLYADRHGIEERLQALLPLLRERLRLEQDEALLLRGSQSAAQSQEQLLRASMPQTAPHSPEQLLRAVESHDIAP